LNKSGGSSIIHGSKMRKLFIDIRIIH